MSEAPTGIIEEVRQTVDQIGKRLSKVGELVKQRKGRETLEEMASWLKSSESEAPENSKKTSPSEKNKIPGEEIPPWDYYRRQNLLAEILGVDLGRFRPNSNELGILDFITIPFSQVEIFHSLARGNEKFGINLKKASEILGYDQQLKAAQKGVEVINKVITLASEWAGKSSEQFDIDPAKDIFILKSSAFKKIGGHFYMEAGSISGKKIIVLSPKVPFKITSPQIYAHEYGHLSSSRRGISRIEASNRNNFLLYEGTNTFFTGIIPTEFPDPPFNVEEIKGLPDYFQAAMAIKEEIKRLDDRGGNGKKFSLIIGLQMTLGVSLEIMKRLWEEDPQVTLPIVLIKQ